MPNVSCMLRLPAEGGICNIQIVCAQHGHQVSKIPNYLFQRVQVPYARVRTPKHVWI